MSNNSPLAILALTVLTSLACGGGDDGSSDVDAGPDQPIELRGSCLDSERIGGFSVAVQATNAGLLSSVGGRVENGVAPATIREEVGVFGDCRMLRSRNPFCDPACANDQDCNTDGTCTAKPRRVAVGTITITGLEEEVVMEPLEPNKDYNKSVTANPIFTPGAEIRLRSSEGTYGAMAMGGFGFEPLEFTGDEWSVAPAADFPLTWTPSAATDTKTRLSFRLSIDQHGTTPVVFECDFEDSGSATIPAAGIDALLAEGVSGFPNGIATRRTSDRLTVSDGCVDFTVSSRVSGTAKVEGHTPCTNDNQCPDGQTCDIPNETCI